MDHLPFVLLGLRTSVREDSGCFPSDLVFGSALRLPGDIFIPSFPLPSASEFVERLQTVVRSATPMPVVHHGTPPSRTDPALATSSHVFLRVDAVKRPLVPPYKGPFPVLKRSAKTFDILWKNKPYTVSVDRLKPAYCDKNEVPIVPDINTRLKKLANYFPNESTPHPSTPHPVCQNSQQEPVFANVTDDKPVSRSYKEALLSPIPTPVPPYRMRSGRLSVPVIRFSTSDRDTGGGVVWDR